MLRPRNDHALSKTRLNPMHRTCYVMRAANAGTRSNPSWSCCPGRTFWTSPCQQHETIMSHFESKNKNTRNSSRLNYDDTRLLELQDLPSNVLIWEGPTVQMLSRNAVQRSELLGRKKQSLCCLCHQKLISPCRQSFKNMGVRGIGGKFVWLIPVRKPLPCITGGGGPVLKILSIISSVCWNQPEKYCQQYFTLVLLVLKGDWTEKTAECCASHCGAMDCPLRLSSSELPPSRGRTSRQDQGPGCLWRIGEGLEILLGISLISLISLSSSVLLHSQVLQFVHFGWRFARRVKPCLYLWHVIAIPPCYQTFGIWRGKNPRATGP